MAYNAKLKTWNLDAVIAEIKANALKKLDKSRTRVVGPKGKKTVLGFCLRYTHAAVIKGFGQGSLETAAAGTMHAKNYGSILTNKEMNFGVESLPLQIGDIAVMNGRAWLRDDNRNYLDKNGNIIPDNDEKNRVLLKGDDLSGHTCLWTGSNWYSDFEQNNLYPGSAYLADKPGYTLYRYQGPILYNGVQTLNGVPIEQASSSDSEDELKGAALKAQEATRAQKDLPKVVIQSNSQAASKAPQKEASSKLKTSFEESAGFLDSLSNKSKVQGPEAPKKKAVAPQAPTIPIPKEPPKAVESAQRAALKAEAKAVKLGEDEITASEESREKSKLEANQLMEKGFEGAVSAAQKKVMQQVKPLGAVVKGAQVASATTRTYSAAKKAFRQGMAFGWPWGAAIGAAASVATIVAGKLAISKIKSVSFEEGGPVELTEKGSLMRGMARPPQARSVKRTVTPTINIEVDGDADPVVLGHLQDAVDQELSDYSRRLELSRGISS